MSAFSHTVGDKVKIRHNGSGAVSNRGILLHVGPTRLVVRLTSTDSVVTVSPKQVTNFSLAARKAWKSMPDRQVGRPRGSKVCDRISVTIRLDRSLWEQFRQAENGGVVTDRTTVLNNWIYAGLQELASTPGRKT